MQKIDKDLVATFEALNTSGLATKFPIVQPAFDTIAKIFETAQKIRVYRDDFIEFAEEGCGLVISIIFRLKDMQEIDENMKANLEELVETLKSIQAFGEKCAARGTIKAILLHGFDINEIKAQRRRLERCIRLFEFRSVIDLREKTIKLVEQQIKNTNTTANLNNTPENKLSIGIDSINADHSSGANVSNTISNAGDAADETTDAVGSSNM